MRWSSQDMMIDDKKTDELAVKMKEIKPWVMFTIAHDATAHILSWKMWAFFPRNILWILLSCVAYEICKKCNLNERNRQNSCEILYHAQLLVRKAYANQSNFSRALKNKSKVECCPGEKAKKMRKLLFVLAIFLLLKAI